MKYEISTLSNGLRVVAAPLKERRSVAMGIWVHAGGRDETPRLNGAAHFLEHVVFKGTATRTADQIKEAVEGVGGSLNAFTSEEYTCFLAKASSKHFNQVFDVLADMVLNPSLTGKDIEKERTVILEEIKMVQDQPGQLAEEHLAEITWPGHPIGRPLTGTLDTVGSFTRKDIKYFRDYFYKPNLITVAASGAIDQRKLLKAAASHFGAIRQTAEKKFEEFKNTQTKPRLKLLSKPTEQTHLAFAIHALPKDHPDEYALDILSVILGGNMSSRLFNEVREKRGLAYDIGSFTRKFRETGVFGVEAGVDNKKVNEAVRVIAKELGKTAQGLVKPGELKRAKEFYLGQLDLGLESSMSHMIWVGESAVSLGRCKTPAEVARHVGKVTAHDLRRVARNIFKTSSLNFVAIGPRKHQLEKALHGFLFSALPDIWN